MSFEQSDHLSLSSVCSAELSLTVALVVFVMLTLFLLAVLILLAVSKNFRTFFFRGNGDDCKREAETETSPERESNEQTKLEQPAPDRKAATRTRRASSKVYDGIPTVPLDAVMSGSEAEQPERKTKRAAKRNSGYSGIATVEIPPVETTYITRSSTVAKARGSARKDRPIGVVRKANDDKE